MTLVLSNVDVLLGNYTLYGFHAAPGIYPETNYLLEINGLNWSKNKIANLDNYDADGDIHGNPFIFIQIIKLLQHLAVISII